MNTELSILQIMLDAGIVVQLVVVILLVLSVCCWALIIGKSRRSIKLQQQNRNFEDEFWSGISLNDLYLSSNRDLKNQGQTKIAPNEWLFIVGMREYQKFKEKSISDANVILNSMQRIMQMHCQKEIERLENGLAFLGSVASAAPYIGLLGTVWGIMHAFTGLSAMSQVTLASVAPGIAEALVATAIGLMTAIPAVLAYNYFSRKNERIILQMESFTDNFVSLMQRNLTPNAEVKPVQ